MMAALKLLVVVMGILIVLGVGLLFYGLATRLEPLRGAGFADGRVELPAGGHIIEMAAAGDRVVLRVGLADGAERLVVVDIARGRALGTVLLARPGDPAPDARP